MKIQRSQGKNFLFDKRQEQIPEKKPSEETEKEAEGAFAEFFGPVHAWCRLVPERLRAAAAFANASGGFTAGSSNAPCRLVATDP